VDGIDNFIDGWLRAGTIETKETAGMLALEMSLP